VNPRSDIERDLQRLESELRQLEAEYNMFFAGGLPRPPWESRARVDVLIKQLDRGYIENYGDRFRFTTLQSRFAALVDLWDRGLRARDEGRPGPYGRARQAPAAAGHRPGNRIVHVTAFHGEGRETEKLRELYDSLVMARRDNGEEPVPFRKFADVVQRQIAKLAASGTTEVAFRVAVKNGRVSLTARGLKGVKE
jgi:hypothetical protein